MHCSHQKEMLEMDAIELSPSNNHTRAVQRMKRAWEQG